MEIRLTEKLGGKERKIEEKREGRKAERGGDRQTEVEGGVDRQREVEIGGDRQWQSEVMKRGKGWKGVERGSG